LVGLNFERNKKCSKYSIKQGVGGLKTFQAKNNALIILGFQLVDCLHMKFGKSEAVIRPQIKRKKFTKT